MVDDFRFREDRADAADLDGPGGAERIEPDIGRSQAEITSGPLQERSRAGCALVIQAKGPHASAIIDANGLDVLPADIENSAYLREVVEDGQSVTGEFGDLRVPERYHVAA